MTAAAPDLVASCRERIDAVDLMPVFGRVCSLVGTVVEVEGLRIEAGSLCRIDAGPCAPVLAEVLGFRGDRSVLMPLGDPARVAPGASVRRTAWGDLAPQAEACLGRVLDGLGRPLDGGPPPPASDTLVRVEPSSSPLARRRIERPVGVGVRSVDALLTIGEGSRIGLFAGSGVGKSTLLGQIARHADADVFVVALVGERGREVREFVERDLGDALSRSIVVVATSDDAPALRRRAAVLGTVLASSLRARGLRVVLLMDSLSRVAAAQREIGLAVGEPPATRGYPPSVWSTLPRLLERAGNEAGAGSVTGLYTVLVEGDDLEDPVADAARSFLDGHIVLSRQLAERGHHPAIDVLASVSRVMPQVVDARVVDAAARARALLSVHADAEDLLAIGAYQDGSDPRIDEAIRIEPALTAFLRQSSTESCSLAQSCAALEIALGGEAP